MILTKQPPALVALKTALGYFRRTLSLCCGCGPDAGVGNSGDPQLKTQLDACYSLWAVSAMRVGSAHFSCLSKASSFKISFKNKPASEAVEWSIGLDIIKTIHEMRTLQKSSMERKTTQFEPAD